MTINMLISCLIIVVSPIGGVFANLLVDEVKKDYPRLINLANARLVDGYLSTAFVPTYGVCLSITLKSNGSKNALIRYLIKRMITGNYVSSLGRTLSYFL
ncbi:hypothetical protein EfmAA818_09600 [Enterococcus faecium]|nr:hypothetical protein EfmAA818_09600 [Enterococcus faecium]